jgi:hypothetical protein
MTLLSIEITYLHTISWCSIAVKDQNTLGFDRGGSLRVFKIHDVGFACEGSDNRHINCKYLTEEDVERGMLAELGNSTSRLVIELKPCLLHSNPPAQ